MTAEPLTEVMILLAGAVFVVGRSKDVIIRGGINFHAHEIERAVEELTQAGPGSVIAFSWIDESVQRERAVLMMDDRIMRSTSDREGILSRHVVKEIGLAVDDVVFVPRRTLPRTTSGKLQRSVAREIYLDLRRRT